MEASLIRFKKDKIEIKRDDGRTFILAPTMFSEQDQKYLAEARTRTDSSGEFWSKERAIYHLTKQKWATKKSGDPLLMYNNFKREKIDLDGDGKFDGYKLWIQSNRIYRGGAMAWEVNEKGNLVVRHILGKNMHAVEYCYDFESGHFMKKGGSLYGARFYRPADDN